MADGETPAINSSTTPDLAAELGIDYLRDVVQIGRGGFAHVFAATDTRFERRVAVKVFDQLLTDDDRILFETECRTTGRLSAVPGVITVHDVDYTADGRPCIVMAHIAGGSLGDQLRHRGRVAWPRAVAYLVAILRALDQAHRHGVLHRDIKPENILVDGERVFLTDFGLATIRAGATGDPAGANVIASPLHAPPETFTGGIRDERSDVYSSASTLYNLITGHAPFQLHGDLTPEALVQRLRSQPPTRIPADLAPAALDTLVRRALAKDPADRPQSAAELADALQAVLETIPAPPERQRLDPGPLPPVAAPERVAVTQSAPTDTAEPPPTPAAGPPVQPSNRSRWRWWQR